MDDVNIRPRFLGCPGAKWDEEWQRTNLNLIDAECRRFMKPQIDSVGSNTDLVMFTGGGNDAKFAKIVEQCFAIGLRDPGDCRDNVDFADTLIATQLGARLDTVFGALRGRLRTDAQVLYVGYPYLVDDVDYTLKTINPFNDDEYAAGDNVRRVGEAGDNVQRAAVRGRTPPERTSSPTWMEWTSRRCSMGRRRTPTRVRRGTQTAGSMSSRLALPRSGTTSIRKVIKGSPTSSQRATRPQVAVPRLRMTSTSSSLSTPPARWDPSSVRSATT